MKEGKRRRPKLVWIVCLVAVAVLGLAMFGFLAALSRPGIGIVDNNNADEGISPVGTWKSERGTIWRILADGTATLASSRGEVMHVDWRLDGTEFGFFYHGPQNSVGGRWSRIHYRLGLGGDWPHDRFKLVEVLPDKMIMAIDEEPKAGVTSFERGDLIKFVAVPE